MCRWFVTATSVGSHGCLSCSWGADGDDDDRRDDDDVTFRTFLFIEHNSSELPWEPAGLINKCESSAMIGTSRLKEATGSRDIPTT